MIPIEGWEWQNWADIFDHVYDEVYFRSTHNKVLVARRHGSLSWYLVNNSNLKAKALGPYTRDEAMRLADVYNSLKQYPPGW